MTTALRPPADDRRAAFSTGSPDEAHGYVCRTYSDTELRLVGDQGGFRLQEKRTDLGSLALVDFRHTTGMELLAEPLGRLMVARVVAGSWRRETIGEQRRVRAGGVCLLAQPDRPCLTGWSGPIHLQLIAVDPTTLLDVAAAPGGQVPRFTSLSPATADGRRLLVRVLDRILHEVVESPATWDKPIVHRSAARLLAAAMLEAIPSTAVREAGAADRSDAGRSRVLDAAVAYVHDHAHLDITVRHLAEAAGVSRQAVHLAFRRQLQTTPQTYLDRVRLDRAHRDLTDLDPAAATVAQIALLWGFAGLARFRAAYVRTYGRPPEATLAG